MHPILAIIAAVVISIVTLNSLMTNYSSSLPSLIPIPIPILLTITLLGFPVVIIAIILMLLITIVTLIGIVAFVVVVVGCGSC